MLPFFGKQCLIPCALILVGWFVRLLNGIFCWLCSVFSFCLFCQVCCESTHLVQAKINHNLTNCMYLGKLTWITSLMYNSTVRNQERKNAQEPFLSCFSVSISEWTPTCSYRRFDWGNAYHIWLYLKRTVLELWNYAFGIFIKARKVWSWNNLLRHLYLPDISIARRSTAPILVMHKGSLHLYCNFFYYITAGCAGNTIMKSDVGVLNLIHSIVVEKLGWTCLST